MPNRSRRRTAEVRRQVYNRTSTSRELKRLKGSLQRFRTAELAKDVDPGIILKSAYEEEIRRHSSLVTIIDLPVGHPARQLSGQELLDAFGYTAYSAITWNTDSKDEDYGGRDLADGGCMIASWAPSASIAAFVFLNDKECLPEESSAKAWMRMGLLYHETGHVDDVEQAINFREGKVNLAAAETYAHHYAAKRLIDGGYRFTLAWYLKEMIRQQLESPFGLVRKAAEDFVASTQYGQYARYAGPHMNSFFVGESGFEGLATRRADDV